MTAHATARKIREPLGLAVDATYRAALFVAHEHGLIDPFGRRSVYDLSPIAKAETVLCACAAGGGLTKALDDFLSGARASGLADRLAGLFEVPEALADSDLIFDADGRAVRVHPGSDGASLVVEPLAGGSPIGRTFTLSGAVLAGVLDR